MIEADHVRTATCWCGQLRAECVGEWVDLSPAASLDVLVRLVLRKVAT